MAPSSRATALDDAGRSRERIRDEISLWRVQASVLEIGLRDNKRKTTSVVEARCMSSWDINVENSKRERPPFENGLELRLQMR